MFRFPSKTNALEFLKHVGVTFGTVLDVGTHAETPELKKAFPEARHLLFEPAAEFFPRIAANYSGLNVELVPMAVSDTDGQGRLRKVAIDGGEVSHSTLVNSDETDAVVNIQTIRLDTFLGKRNEPKPYLLKVDVDGYEVPILRGATGIWEDIDCIIVEATADTFLERLQFIAERDFVLIDIVDQCYYAGVFSQVDLIFVSKRLQQANARLRPWQTEEFSWEKWVPIASYEGHLSR